MIEIHFDQEIFLLFILSNYFIFHSHFFFDVLETFAEFVNFEYLHTTHKFLYLIDFKKYAQPYDDSERQRISTEDQRFPWTIISKLIFIRDKTSAISFELRRLGSTTTLIPKQMRRDNWRRRHQEGDDKLSAVGIQENAWPYIDRYISSLSVRRSLMRCPKHKGGDYRSPRHELPVSRFETKATRSSFKDLAA